MLRADLIGEFTITNERGESLTWDGRELSGDMEVYNVRFYANGEDHPATIEIDVPDAESFHFSQVDANGESSFVVVNSKQYASITGKDIKRIEVNTDEVMLESEGTDFRISYSCPEREECILRAEGTTDGTAVIHVDADGLHVEGTKGDDILYKVDFDGNLIENTEIKAE